MHEEVIATIPQGEADTLLEVVRIYERSGRTSIALRHYSWGDGVGWYRQHTLTLDGSTVRALWRALSQVQHRPGRDSGKGRSPVIPFPGGERTPRGGQGTHLRS